MADPVRPNPNPDMPQHLRNAFNAAFAFRKKYQHPVRTEAFWRACADEMGAISARLGGGPFITDLLAACYNDIIREMEESKR